MGQSVLGARVIGTTSSRRKSCDREIGVPSAKPPVMETLYAPAGRLEASTSARQREIPSRARETDGRLPPVPLMDAEMSETSDAESYEFTRISTASRPTVWDACGEAMLER